MAYALGVIDLSVNHNAGIIGLILVVVCIAQLHVQCTIRCNDKVVVLQCVQVAQVHVFETGIENTFFAGQAEVIYPFGVERNSSSVGESVVIYTAQCRA